MSDNTGGESLDEFEKSSSPSELDEERLFDIDNVELTLNPVGDVACYSDDDTEVSDYAYFSTIGGDLAEDHTINRKSGSYNNSYVLINSGGMDLVRKKNELS
eukprot:15358406-Ditylum_brightwellii.AAC.1